MTADLVDRTRDGAARPGPSAADKWDLLRALGAARVSFGLSDRTLAVLGVLLSFHSDTTLRRGAPLVVFASNATLSARAHGMPESTLRRHMAALVQAGVLRRHDSPNGKRYARRTAGGEIARAFGFDLSPLLERAEEILALAGAEADRQAEIAARREEIALLLRDATKYALYGVEARLAGNWDEVDDRLRLAKRAYRRNLSLEDLDDLRDELAEVLSIVRSLLALPEDQTRETEEMSASVAENERHYQSSNKDNFESKAEVRVLPPTDARGARTVQRLREPKPVTLAQVLTACPELAAFASDPPQDWDAFMRVALQMAPMIGITPVVMAGAIRAMGERNAAIATAFLLQRIGDIRNPGGYLRVLSQRAAEGAFCPAAMLSGLPGMAERRAA